MVLTSRNQKAGSGVKPLRARQKFFSTLFCFSRYMKVRGPQFMDTRSGASTMALAIEMHLPETVPARNQSALAALVDRALAGDHAAFEQIMIHSQQRVMAMSWRMLGNDADARDASQEVF